MDGTPIVGHAFAITLTAKLNAETDVTWSPAFPDWVDGDPSSWRMQGGAGEVRSHVWTLTATREGFWAFQLRDSPSPDAGMGWCCIYAYSAANEGRTGQLWDLTGLFPPAEIDAEHDIVVVGDTAKATYTVKALSPWMRHGEIILSASTHGRDEGAVHIPYGEAKTLEVPLALPPGGNAVATFFVSWNATPSGDGFPDEGLQTQLQCVNVEAIVEAGQAEEGDAWPCEARATSPGLKDFYSPGTGPLTVLALLGTTTLLARRVRP